jgi:hypothetical protein
MVQYQNIEYLITQDGKVSERVISATGSACTDFTAPLEKNLGKIEPQKLFPESYQEEDDLFRL